MINMNPTPRTIATESLRYHFDDIHSRHDLIDYCAEFDDDMTIDADTLRRALIRMIDLDLNDMLHNMNLDFYTSFAHLDALSDDEYETLADRLLDRTDPELIADLLLAIYDDDMLPD